MISRSGIGSLPKSEPSEAAKCLDQLVTSPKEIC
jgi:hypothetical protein